MDQAQTKETRAKKLFSTSFITGLVIALVVGGILVYVFLGGVKKGEKEGITVVKADQAGKILVDFINEVYGPQIGPVTLKEITGKNGLYQVTLTVTNQGQTLDQVVFLSRDSKLFIPQVIDVEQSLAQFRDFQNQAAQPSAALPAAPADQQQPPAEQQP